MRRRGAGLVLGLGLAGAGAGVAGCGPRDAVETSAGAESEPDPPVSMVRGQSISRAEAHDGASLIRVLGCGGCHVGVPVPAESIARPLIGGDRARDPALMFAYLRDSPRGAKAGAAHSPSFHLDEAEALALSLYVAGGAIAGGAARRRFDAARQTHGDIEAADGARIFRALNCAVCHEHDGVEPRNNGPPLAGVASRLRPAALRDFLRRPHAVRPFGFEPGSGGRMPGFVLSDTEVDSIVAYLGTLDVQFEPYESPVSGGLSAFGAAKARALLDQKLSCLGCHPLNGVGGRIGPDLARAGERLTPEYLAAIIRDPQHAMPGTVMPRSAMPRRTRDLIITFLAGVGTASVNGDTSEVAGSAEDAIEAERAGYLSLIDHAVTYPAALPPSAAGASSGAATDPAAALYAARCATCHGADGGGDGHNARYLSTRPAVHASADSMSRRPDDTLFDGIHAGGTILGGGPEMPAFGESLSPRDIASLVAYIRKLCDCRQPAWADDGQ